MEHDITDEPGLYAENARAMSKSGLLFDNILKDSEIGFQDEIDKMIDEVGKSSRKLCAKCGSIENVQPTEGWIIYLCQKCQ